MRYFQVMHGSISASHAVLRSLLRDGGGRGPVFAVLLVFAEGGIVPSTLLPSVPVRRRLQDGEVR